MAMNGNGSRRDSCDQNSSNSKPYQRTQELNDTFRQTGKGGQIVITRGIQALEDNTRNAIINMIKGVSEFALDNDPYGTHDFGSVKIENHIIFWKIDCYNLDLICLSPDPSDPEVTRRVMTIMLAEEY